MFKLLLALFILIPLIEIYLFIEVGGYIGAFPTLGLILFTAVAGVSLVRIQGLITLEKIRQATDHGELPAIELIEGLILLIAGALLLTPGFFTDTLGFLCLLPRVRKRLATMLLVHYFVLRTPRDDSQPVVIEGKFRNEDDLKIK